MRLTQRREDRPEAVGDQRRDRDPGAGDGGEVGKLRQAGHRPDRKADQQPRPTPLRGAPRRDDRQQHERQRGDREAPEGRLQRAQRRVLVDDRRRRADGPHSTPAIVISR
jgi:hypothetical protein